MQNVEWLPGFFLLLNVGRERETKETLLNMKEPGLDGLNSKSFQMTNDSNINLSR